VHNLWARKTYKLAERERSRMIERKEKGGKRPDLMEVEGEERDDEPREARGWVRVRQTLRRQGGADVGVGNVCLSSHPPQPGSFFNSSVVMFDRTSDGV
jgi:hypothetical protein